MRTSNHRNNVLVSWLDYIFSEILPRTYNLLIFVNETRPGYIGHMAASYEREGSPSDANKGRSVLA